MKYLAALQFEASSTRSATNQFPQLMAVLCMIPYTSQVKSCLTHLKFHAETSVCKVCCVALSLKITRTAWDMNSY